MLSPFFYGLTIGFSLILAIGAQNAFVLKQGLKNQYVFWVCLICALSDSALIYLGVTGFSTVISQYPYVTVLAKYFGAIFLLWYGFISFRTAFQDKSILTPSDVEESSFIKVIGVCLAFTWLNPHVYLDTLVLMGSISTQFTGNEFEFTLGAILASWLFFFALGYGSRLLRPVFENPKAWDILEFIIGVVMWGIAITLLMKKV
ncbi:LysE/ArgO family amino acid transporter [Psychrobacter lutiphocae]|uniref:LysE/ArgO family amino acid transporter n=1 Tax=Psychrobacter lutiphocae TaxID=540500 RepID=UPI000363466D|nr:LysE/ArgO family amino acid transporter [Psychrobacter lutiphocae]